MIQVQLALQSGELVSPPPGTRVRFNRDDDTCAVYVPKDTGGFDVAKFTGTALADDKVRMVRVDDFQFMTLLSALSGLTFKNIKNHGYGGNSVVYELVGPDN